MTDKLHCSTDVLVRESTEAGPPRMSATGFLYVFRGVVNFLPKTIIMFN